MLSLNFTVGLIFLHWVWLWGSCVIWGCRMNTSHSYLSLLNHHSLFRGNRWKGSGFCRALWGTVHIIDSYRTTQGANIKSCALHTLTHITLILILWRRKAGLYFTEERVEAQRGQVTALRSHSKWFGGWSPGFWIEVPASGLSLGALSSTPSPPPFSSISVTGTIWLSIDTCMCLKMWTDPVRSACGLNSSSLDGAASSDGGCPSISTTWGSEWREMSSPRSPTTRLKLHPVLQPSISKGRKQLPYTPRKEGEGGWVSWLAGFTIYFWNLLSLLFV